MVSKVEEELQRALLLESTKLGKYSPQDIATINNAQSILDERAKTLYDMDEDIGEILRLKTVTTMQDHNWQPSDLLPSMHEEGWVSTFKKLIKEMSNIPIEIQAVLIGNTITEEGLPTYAMNTHVPEGARDLTGTQQTNYSKWGRVWNSDENKHGKTLEGMLAFSNKLNMRSIHDSIQNLLKDGFNPGIGKDPYKLIFYTGFQEPATEISHLNTAKLAFKHGSETLHNVCRKITGDESRHKSFYQALAQKVFEVDPENAMIAYAHLMKKGIDMPAQLLSDTQGNPLFQTFSNIARKIGVYTAQDYVKILKQTSRKYKIESAQVFSDEAKRAQDFLVALPERLSRISARQDMSKQYVDVKSLPWFRAP